MARTPLLARGAVVFATSVVVTAALSVACGQTQRVPPQTVPAARPQTPRGSTSTALETLWSTADDIGRTPDRKFLGDLSARLQEPIEAVAVSKTFVALAFATGVELIERQSKTRHRFADIRAPIALAEDRLLVGAGQERTLVYDLKTDADPLEIAVGRTPTLLSIHNRRVTGGDKSAVWSEVPGDRASATGELFLGAAAPTPVASTGEFVIVVDRMLNRVQVLSPSSGAIRLTASLPKDFDVVSGAVDHTGATAVVFGQLQGGKSIAVVASGEASRTIEVEAALKAAVVTRAGNVLVLDTRGQVFALDAAKPNPTRYDPGDIVAPVSTLTLVENENALVVTHHNMWTVLDLGTLREKVPFGHRDHVTALAFSPDGSTLFSVAMDATVRAWNPVTGAELSRVRVPAALGGVWDVQAPSAESVVVLSSPDVVTRVAMPSGAQVFSTTMAVPPSSTSVIRLTPSGAILAFSPRHLLWLDGKTGEETSRLSGIRLPRHVVTGGSVVQMGEELLVRKAPGCADGGAFNPTTNGCRSMPSPVVRGRAFATGADGAVIAHGPRTVLYAGGKTRSIPLGTDRFDAVAFVDDGRAAMFVNRKMARLISLEDANFGRPLWQQELPPLSRVRAVAVSPDGWTVARAGVPRAGDRRSRSASRAIIELTHRMVVDND